MTKQLVNFFLMVTMLNYGCNSVKPSQVDPNKEINLITGTVLSSESKANAYIVKILAPDDKIYHASMKKNTGIKIKNRIVVQGKLWKSQGINYITVDKVISNDADNFRIYGKVQSSIQNSDGFTAMIKTKNEETYFVAVSISNLGENYKKYREYQKGENVEVYGNLWSLKNEKSSYCTWYNLIAGFR